MDPDPSIRCQDAPLRVFASRMGVRSRKRRGCQSDQQAATRLDTEPDELTAAQARAAKSHTCIEHFCMIGCHVLSPAARAPQSNTQGMTPATCNSQVAQSYDSSAEHTQGIFCDERIGTNFLYARAAQAENRPLGHSLLRFVTHRRRSIPGFFALGCRCDIVTLHAGADAPLRLRSLSQRRLAESHQGSGEGRPLECALARRCIKVAHTASQYEHHL